MVFAGIAARVRPGQPISSSTAPGSRALIAHLVTVVMLGHASFTGARLALTLRGVDLQASPAVVGLLLSLVMLVPGLASVSIGRWTDRAGFRKPTACGLALLAGAEGVAACTGSVWGLGLAAILMGTGYIFAHIALNHAIALAAGPEHRVRAFGLVAMAFSASSLSGSIVAGSAIDHVGYAACFGLLAVLPLASMAWTLRMPEAGGRTAQAAAVPHAGALGLLALPPMRRVMVANAMVAIGWDLFTFLVPLHAARLGLSASMIGIVVGAFGAGTFFGRLALPALVRAAREWPLLRIILGLGAAGYALLPLLVGAPALVALAFLLGVVLGGGQPLVMSLLVAAAPAGRAGEAMGLRVAISSAGQTVLPLLFGALGTATGMLPLFWTAAATLAAGCAYLTWRHDDVARGSV